MKKPLWTKIPFFSGAFMLMILIGCGTEEKIAEPERMHFDYVKLDSGMAFSFMVDSYKYDDFNNTIDTSRHLVKHKVLDAPDTAGGQYRLKRLVMDSTGGPVKDARLYTARKTNTDYQVFLGNTRVVNLVFPVKQSKTWDAQVYTADSQQTYHYANVHTPFETGEFMFDSTAEVIERDEENLIERNFIQTIYAKQYGKVYHKEMDLRFKGDSIPPRHIPWEEKANTGHIVIHRLQKFHSP